MAHLRESPPGPRRMPGSPAGLPRIPENRPRMPLVPILTLGPATSSPDMMAALLGVAGAFRLNASHLVPESLARWLEALDRVFHSAGHTVPVYVDLQGAKMRIGSYPDCRFLPERVHLILGEKSETPQTIPVPHPAFFQAVRAGDLLTLNDARVGLRVLSTDDRACQAEVVRDGPLSSHKGLNRRGHPLPCPSLSEGDRRAVEVALDHEFVRFAFSFVHDGTEADLIRPRVGGRVVAAKIELPEALDHLGGIADRFDELWLCRGDLGAQAGLAALGSLQETFVRRATGLGRPRYLAGQVLEYMTHFPQPTRAEVVGLFQAEREGFAGVVLSDETAVGRHPLEVARLLAELGFRASFSPPCESAFENPAGR